MRRNRFRSSGMFTVRTRRRRPFSSLLLSLLVGLILFSALYTAIDNGRVVVRQERVTISSLSSTLEGYTILHISDLSGQRFGTKQRAISQALQNKTYHAVCITGDSLGPNQDPYPLYELIAALDPTKPIFFIAGDGDPEPINTSALYSKSILADFIVGAQTKGARYLDSTQSIQYKGETIWFSPDVHLMQKPADAESSYRSQLSRLTALGIDAQTQSLVDSIYYHLETIVQEQAARAQIQDNSLHILLAHRPLQESIVPILQGWASTGDSYYRSIGLILSGHYAGGQWRIPFLGPLYARPQGFFPTNIEGLTTLGSYTQHISRGLGNASDTPFPRFRLFNSPEITLIQLTSSL